MRFIEEKESQSLCAVVAIFNEVRQVLILKRGPTAPWEPNQWSLVGGMAEAGENMEEAVRREVREETQMSVTDLKEYKEVMASWGTLFVFTAQSRDRPVLDYENTEYAWVTENDLNHYNFVPNVKEILISLF